MSRELAASSSFFKKRAPAPVPFPSENEIHRASSSLVAIKLSNIKVGREARGMFNYNLDIILCSSTKIKREMYISVCTKKVERRETNK